MLSEEWVALLQRHQDTSFLAHKKKLLICLFQTYPLHTLKPLTRGRLRGANSPMLLSCKPSPNLQTLLSKVLLCYSRLPCRKERCLKIDRWMSSMHMKDSGGSPAQKNNLSCTPVPFNVKLVEIKSATRPRAKKRALAQRDLIHKASMWVGIIKRFKIVHKKIT